MKKNGFDWLGPLVWTGFVLLGCWLFNKILSEGSHDMSQYHPIMLLVVLSTLAVTLYKSWQHAKIERVAYDRLEKVFPELATDFSLLTTEASYYDQLGFLAIYKNHLISNWSPVNFVNLEEVKTFRAYRTAGVKNRQGTVAGNKPMLEFTLTSGEKVTLALKTLNTETHSKALFAHLQEHYPHIVKS